MDIQQCGTKLWFLLQISSPPSVYFVRVLSRYVYIFKKCVKCDALLCNARPNNLDNYESGIKKNTHPKIRSAFDCLPRKVLL